MAKWAFCIFDLGLAVVRENKRKSALLTHKIVVFKVRLATKKGFNKGAALKPDPFTARPNYRIPETTPCLGTGKMFLSGSKILSRVDISVVDKRKKGFVKVTQ